MEQQTIFNEKEITVIHQYHNPEVGWEYLVHDGIFSFTTSVKPVLEYESLKKELSDYQLERYDQLISDTADNDYFDNSIYSVE